MEHCIHVELVVVTQGVYYFKRATHSHEGLLDDQAKTTFINEYLTCLLQGCLTIASTLPCLFLQLGSSVAAADRPALDAGLTPFF